MIFWNPGSRDVFSFSAKNNGGLIPVKKKHRFWLQLYVFPKAWFHLEIFILYNCMHVICLPYPWKHQSHIINWFMVTVNVVISFEFLRFLFCGEKKTSTFHQTVTVPLRKLPSRANWAVVQRCHEHSLQSRRGPEPPEKGTKSQRRSAH